MSVLADMYNAVFTVYRATTTSSTATDTATALVSGNCVFTPISDRTQLYDESNFGKEFRMFCPIATNIRAGDIVKISGVSYTVAGLAPHVDLEDGVESHQEVRIIRK